uniref:Uncharacterized protein n=1 Tax=Amphimedon queenslandica TaxID=400682 RepID=A0A1X7UHC1_AMPQE
MASNSDAGFKVSVESLHTTRVKEINYDGEEIYEGRPSPSQKLSKLAQHVDFREERADDDNDKEEGNKKRGGGGGGTLTEVSVLSDVLQIVHNHHQYLSLDPVYVNKKYTLPPSYQYQIKKKVQRSIGVLLVSFVPIRLIALDVASKILRKGAEPPLKRLSSQTDHKFYRALYDLKRRWILRRTANGVSGDLIYRSGNLIVMKYNTHTV